MIKKIVLIFSVFFALNSLAQTNSNITHRKVSDAISNLQATYWGVTDLLANNQIQFKGLATKQMFEEAVEKVMQSNLVIKRHLTKDKVIDLSLLTSEMTTSNNSYLLINQLIYLKEISVDSVVTDLKFEQARHRLMLAIMRLREYIENGDDDIFNPLNQRNSAITLFKLHVSSAWEKDLVGELPIFISQTDLVFIKEMIRNVAPGSMSRHLKAYFSQHPEDSVEGNFKGVLAVLLINNVTGWTVENLDILPGFISKDMLAKAKTIIESSPSYQVKDKLEILFKAP